MSELYLMAAITRRERLPDYEALYQKKHIATSLVTLGRDLVSRDDAKTYFVNQGGRALLFSMVTWETWKEVRREMQRNLQIDLPGAGIAFLVPLSSIGGRRELAFLTEGQNFVREEEKTMKGTDRELLVVVCDQGYNEMVMDAARDAGANGGTVVNARGTGMERAEKFFGISLASEKDMVFIVVRTDIRDRVMQEIMLKAGMGTQAKAMVFSLPVADAAGFRLTDQDDEPETTAKAE